MLLLSYKMIQDYRYYTIFEWLYNLEQFEVLRVWDVFSKESPENLHNLGNVSYRIFERTTNLEPLKDAVAYYSGALQYEEHEDTRFNYEFTKDMLELLMAPEEENDQEQEQDNEEQESENTDESDQQNSSPSDQWSSDETIQDQRREGYYLEEEQEVPELSESEREQIEEYTEALKQEQQYNQQFFNKQDIPSEFWNIFDNFFWNVNRWGERDW